MAKLLNALLIITSLMGYLEWGSNSHVFLLEGEMEIIAKLFRDPMSVAHPIILLPLLGQVLLLVTLFQSKPSKWLSLIGMTGIGLLFLLMLIVGILSVNYLIIISTLPYTVTVGFMLRHYIMLRDS